MDTLRALGHDPAFTFGVWVGFISYGYLSLMWRMVKLERLLKERK